MLAGDDLVKAVPQFDKERLPDAHGLVDIESSFSKLVGNKFKAALDFKFLKIVAHVIFGKLVCNSRAALNMQFRTSCVANQFCCQSKILLDFTVASQLVSLSPC